MAESEKHIKAIADKVKLSIKPLDDQAKKDAGEEHLDFTPKPDSL